MSKTVEESNACIKKMHGLDQCNELCEGCFTIYKCGIPDQYSQSKIQELEKENERLRGFCILSHQVVVNEQEGEYDHDVYDKWCKEWEQFKEQNNL